MAYIEGIPKNQYLLLPPLVEDWIPEDHPARIINMFVDMLDTKALGIIENNEFTGRPSYNPKIMLKIILYGYSNCERSSRLLERRTYEDLAYIWLAEQLHPDYRSIARFRQNNITQLKCLLKETLKLYQQIGITFSGIIFADGSKIYANASDSNIATEDKLMKLENLAEKILKEAEKIDSEEDEKMGDENKNFFKKEKLDKIKAQIEKCKNGLENSNGEKISLTDSQAKFMKHSSGHGKHLSYNSQISTDANGVIIEADVTNKPTDSGELLEERVIKSEENLGKEVKKVISDAGYFETNKVKKLMKKGKQVIVPNPVDVKKQRGKKKFFDTKDFQYNSKRNEYICPNFNKLKFKGEKKSRGKEYLIYVCEKKDCIKCPLKNKCYRGNENSKCGRRIMIFKDRDFLQTYQKNLKSNKDLLKRRKTIVEPVFGIIKSCLKFRRFGLRGLEKVRGEWSLVCAVANLMKIRRILQERQILKENLAHIFEIIKAKFYKCFSFIISIFYNFNIFKSIRYETTD